MFFFVLLRGNGQVIHGKIILLFPLLFTLPLLARLLEIPFPVKVLERGTLSTLLPFADTVPPTLTHCRNRINISPTGLSIGWLNDEHLPNHKNVKSYYIFVLVKFNFLCFSYNENKEIFSRELIFGNKNYPLPRPFVTSSWPSGWIKKSYYLAKPSYETSQFSP